MRKDYERLTANGPYRMSDEEWAAYEADRAKHPRSGPKRKRETTAPYHRSDRKPRPSRVPEKHKPSRPVRKHTQYQFIDGVPHKVVYVHKAMDVLKAIRLTDNEPVQYMYSQARRHMQRAYSTGETAKIIGRAPATIRSDISKESFKKPFFLAQPRKDAPYFGRWLWREEDILNAHEFYATRRRNLDGEWCKSSVAPVTEVKAVIGGHKRIYVETDDGQYVPLWREPDF